MQPPSPEPHLEVTDTGSAVRMQKKKNIVQARRGEDRKGGKRQIPEGYSANFNWCVVIWSTCAKLKPALDFVGLSLSQADPIVFVTFNRWWGETAWDLA